MPIIAPKWSGRLCNNMWQLAAAYVYTLKHPKYTLGYAPDKMGKGQELAYWLKLDELPLPPGKTSWIEPFDGMYYEIPDRIPGGLLEGYTQHPLYLAGYEDQVRELYSCFTDERVPGRLGIHIRLTDYKKLSYLYWVTTPEWLTKAADLLMSYDIKEIELFSDDPEEATGIMNMMHMRLRDKMRDISVKVNTNKEAAVALRSMTTCQYFIGSNSSMSWWAAWLGRPDIAIFHTPWMHDGRHNDCILDNWVALPD